jgi:hypothetical protein
MKDVIEIIILMLVIASVVHSTQLLSLIERTSQDALTHAANQCHRAKCKTPTTPRAHLCIYENVCNKLIIKERIPFLSATISEHHLRVGRAEKNWGGRQIVGPGFMADVRG